MSTADKLEEVLKAVRDVEAKVDSKLSEMKREIEAADDRLVKKCAWIANHHLRRRAMKSNISSMSKCKIR